MYKTQNTLLSLLFSNALLISCSGEEANSQSASTDLRTVAATNTPVLTDPIDSSDPPANNTVTVQEADQNNGGDTADTVSTRSSQGIEGDGDRRREQARNRRGNGQPAPGSTEQEVRRYDGSGNNSNNTEWGASFVQLQRLAPVGYDDGVSTMAGQSRENARFISNTLVSQAPGQSILNVFGVSDFGWQWGQFLDHDIDLTDGSDFESANIAVPAGDAWFDPTGSGDVEIVFNRALFDPDTGTDASNPRQQENEVTSWIDGSMVYGSSTERLNELRVGSDSPLLKTSAGNLLPFNVNSVTNANGFVSDPSSLFLAGDIRANEQVGLTVIHTLFVREHNRLAARIQQQNPQATAQNVFEDARRLVVAKIQMITYNEHLPALLGSDVIPPYDGYNANVNATIFNEFSASAYRLGHSMVNDSILRLDANGDAIDQGPLTLRSAFFSAPQVLQAENDIDPVLRGLASQVHQRVDVQVVDTLRNFLFGQPGSGGFDLTALNIQRGRDHGLASYNDTREAFGLDRYTSFTDITSDAILVQGLEESYTSVDDIDLWIGGLAEDPVFGSQLGPLFQEIITRQFVALRDGDRFWYQRYLSDEELAEVQGSTLADVIRRNTNIGSELQDNVFYVTGR